MKRALKLIRQNEPLYAAVRGLRDMYSYARGASRGSFSQHGEDTFINARFGHKRNGFYVDVGASHPFRLSNTFLLYQNGWRGVTVEPIPLLGRLHRRWRPQDNLVQKAVGPMPGKLTFQEMLPSVLSTLDPMTAQSSVSEGRAQLLRCYEIDVVTLDQLFTNYVGRRTVDLLSLDLEGLDAETITNFRLDDTRPTLICIEFADQDTRSKMLAYFEQCKYRLVVELGCNLIVENASP